MMYMCVHMRPCVLNNPTRPYTGGRTPVRQYRRTELVHVLAAAVSMSTRPSAELEDARVMALSYSKPNQELDDVRATHPPSSRRAKNQTKRAGPTSKLCALHACV